MADMYGEKDRGKSLAMVTLLPFLGPALGPIVGGLVTELVNWPWIFWIMSAFNAVILTLGVFVIRETYTPVLLRRKAVAEGTGTTATRLSTAQIRKQLLKPIQILIRRPVIWVNSLSATISFGSYALMLTSYATLWIKKYNQSELVSSLHYIAIAVGSTVSGQVGGHIMDAIYRSLSNRSAHGKGKPEFRIPYMVLGQILMPVGLLLYGWAAEYRLPWAVVDLGVVLFTIGSFVTGASNVAYQVGEFGKYSASAGAASRSVSYLLAFVFPIFAPLMYDDLGYGWGNCTLALATLVLGLPICWGLWFFGERLRAVGKTEEDE